MLCQPGPGTVNPRRSSGGTGGRSGQRCRTLDGAGVDRVRDAPPAALDARAGSGADARASPVRNRRCRIEAGLVAPGARGVTRAGVAGRLRRARGGVRRTAGSGPTAGSPPSFLADIRFSPGPACSDPLRIAQSRDAPATAPVASVDGYGGDVSDRSSGATNPAGGATKPECDPARARASALRL